MSEANNDQRLEDYVDGLLPEHEVAEVERWLESSEKARATVAFLRSLRQQAAQLPVEIEPSRDLWPGVRARMAPAPLAPVTGETAQDRPVRRASWWPRLQPAQWATLAAAATILVVTSSAITAWVVGTTAPDGLPEDPAAVVTQASADEAEAAPIEARYGAEIEQLLWALYESRDSLDPDTVTTIETNLRVINRAIRSAREALQDDPGNDGLNRLLDSNYRRKLELLQRAQRIIEMS